MKKEFRKALRIGGSLLLLWFATIAQAEWISFNDDPTPKSISVEIVKSDVQSTIVKYEVFGVERNSEFINNDEYAKLSIPESSVTDAKGLPELPRIGKSIMIPSSSLVRYQILEKETKEISLGIVAPSKGDILRTVNPEMVPYSFSEFYGSNDVYPSKQFRVGVPFSFRNVKGVNLQFTPFKYHDSSAMLEVITKLVVEIKTETPESRTLRILSHGQGMHPEFEALYANHLANYQKFMNSLGDRASKFVPEGNKIMVVIHPSFVDAFQPYIAWNTQKGGQVKTLVVENGMTYQKIKEAIQKEYTANGLSYVILVGDAEFVPYYVGTSGNVSGNEADPMYGLTEGNDNYPDLFVSRISVKTNDDVKNIVTRTINYEKYPDLAGDWYSKATGIASNEGSPTDWERAEELRKMMEAWHYTKVDKFYDPGASASSLTEALNEGRSYINYIGHGSKTSWGTTGFSNSNIDALNNGSKLPFIISVACVNGDFGAGSDAFAERWLKAGTAENPKGAIAIYASSTNQSWVPPTIGQKEITTILTQEKASTIGGLFFNGVIAVLDDNSSSAVQTFQSWHIFGDAALKVRTKKPVAISAILPEAIGTSQNMIKINVGEKGINIGVAQDGKLIASGKSGADGLIQANFIESAKPGKALVTLTGFNKIPLIKEINVVN